MGISTPENFVSRGYHILCKGVCSPPRPPCGHTLDESSMYIHLMSLSVTYLGAFMGGRWIFYLLKWICIAPLYFSNYFLQVEMFYRYWWIDIQRMDVVIMHTSWEPMPCMGGMAWVRQYMYMRNFKHVSACTTHWKSGNNIGGGVSWVEKTLSVYKGMTVGQKGGIEPCLFHPTMGWIVPKAGASTSSYKWLKIFITRVHSQHVLHIWISFIALLGAWDIVCLQMDRSMQNYLLE